MKNISIKATKKLPHDPKFIDQYRGILRIADKKLKFFAAINIWSIDDYKRQWKEGLKRILVNDTSCLITDVPNLGAEPSVMI
jgi:contact-dependent growth inhibition (CDI) system CdiI-like immunity protein